MNYKDALYRLRSYLKHQITAWNTGGEGIHSPSLFYIVRMLLYDKNRYYCFDTIEQQRQQLLRDNTLIETLDFGTGGSPDGHPIPRRISDIARHHLESPRIGQFLFRLADYMGSRAQRPLTIVELGTSLGITTAYLASAHTHDQIFTLEGSPQTAQHAQYIWKQLGIKNIRLIEGAIDNTIYKDTPARVDFAYIDANHTLEATLRYFRFLHERCNESSIIVVDDIHHSREMEQAWQTILREPGVTSTMDLFAIGLVFFDPHYLRKHYRLRI